MHSVQTTGFQPARVHLDRSMRTCRSGIGRAFLARGYFCATVGQMTEEMIKKYLEHHFESNRVTTSGWRPSTTRRSADTYLDFQSVTRTHRLQPVVVQLRQTWSRRRIPGLHRHLQHSNLRSRDQYRRSRRHHHRRGAAVVPLLLNRMRQL